METKNVITASTIEMTLAQCICLAALWLSVWNSIYLVVLCVLYIVNHVRQVVIIVMQD